MGEWESEGSVAEAVVRNTERYVERATADPRYAAAQHQRVPRKIGRRLELLDCVACDKCIAVCPNDAFFSYHLPGAGQARQYAVYADLCNDCGNCDVFCPEDGGPYRLKPRIFTNRERWAADAPRDAILVEPDAVTGRLDGAEYRVADRADGAAHPHHHLLRRLRAALLAPTEVTYVTCALDRDG